MNELLEKINETFDASINTSSEETALQLQILKGNINTLFNEAMAKENEDITRAESAFASSIPVMAPKMEMTQPTSSDKRILIVDDSSIIRNYLQKACADSYNITLATGGQEAINILSGNSYDLILLDLMMPGVDGFGVLDYLKSNGIIVPIIIISGDTTKETIDRAFSYNVVDMIEKPFSEKTIMEKINRVLG